MKKRLLMLALFVMLFAVVFTVSISAKEWTYKDEAGNTYLTLTIDDSTKIVTEYEGRFPMWNEQNQPLTWYVIATDSANGIKTVKSFVSTDPAYTNHGDGLFRFVSASNFNVAGYPAPTKNNVVSVNAPNNANITGFFETGNTPNFFAGYSYTPDSHEILFLRCPNTLASSERIVQGTKALEVEFDKDSTFTEISHVAFHDCQSLRKVNIPASVEVILSSDRSNNGRAFYHCVSLDEVTFDEGSNLESIQMGAFDSANLPNLQLPASLTTIQHNTLSYANGIEVIRLPETFTHFINTNNDGSIRNSHHSFTHCVHALKEMYIPATFYAEMPTTKYQVSYAFDGGNNVKYFYCGTLEQFNIAKTNFINGTTSPWENNGKFLNAEPVDYTTYAAAIKLDPEAYSDNNYVIYNYNSCDAFHGGNHKFDNDCTTADACQNGCGVTATKNESHDIEKTLVFEAGITANGTLTVVCKNENCAPATVTVVEPVFTAKGYSTNPDKNAINGGYSVNLKSLALYEELIGEITYGIVIANANTFGTNSFFNSEYEVNSEKSLKVEMDKQYSNFDCEINFGANTGAKLDLIITAYVITDDGVVFVQKDTGNDVKIGDTTFKSITLAQVVAIQPTTSKED